MLTLGNLGGTAACIVASRLAAADPNLSVLVIEGGQDNYQVDNVVNPALFLEHLAPTSKTAIFYKGNKSEALAGREPIVPSGGILGGGSSINFMMSVFLTIGLDVPQQLWSQLTRLKVYPSSALGL